MGLAGWVVTRVEERVTKARCGPKGQGCVPAGCSQGRRGSAGSESPRYSPQTQLWEPFPPLLCSFHPIPVTRSGHPWQGPGCHAVPQAIRDPHKSIILLANQAFPLPMLADQLWENLSAAPAQVRAAGAPAGPEPDGESRVLMTSWVFDSKFTCTNKYHCPLRHGSALGEQEGREETV